MSSPLASAICLFMLALLGNSWANVMLVPLMDADGNGTTAANVSAINGSMASRNTSIADGSSMVARNARVANKTSMASRNASVADGSSMAAHNGSVFNGSMVARNVSAINGSSMASRNASAINGTSMAVRNASVADESSVEARHVSSVNGTSMTSRNASAVNGDSTMARNTNINGSSIEAHNNSIILAHNGSIEARNHSIILAQNGSMSAQNDSITRAARVRRSANLEMKQQEPEKKMTEFEKEVPLLKQETEEVVPSLKEEHWPSVHAYNQMPKIVPPEVALERFYKAVEIVMRTNATNDKKVKGTDDAADNSPHNDEEKEADEGKQEEVTEEEWNEEERKEEEEWKEDKEGKKQDEGKEDEERKKEEEWKMKEWKEEVEGGKKEEGKEEEEEGKEEEIGGKEEEGKKDEEERKEEEDEQFLKVPMDNHNDEDGQGDGPMAVGQKNQQVLLFHIRFIVRHRQHEEEPSEQKFLKTVHVMEFPHIYPVPDCIVVFFDSRTLDPQKDRMGRLLLSSEPRPSFGTNDGANEWAASKVICGPKQRDAFMFELNWLRHLHKDVPMELGLHEKEVRKVLKQKMAEIMAPPPHDEIFKFEHGGG